MRKAPTLNGIIDLSYVISILDCAGTVVGRRA